MIKKNLLFIILYILIIIHQIKSQTQQQEEEEIDFGEEVEEELYENNEHPFFFLETFSNTKENEWKKSEIEGINGEWSIEKTINSFSILNDFGLVIQNKSEFYAISHVFDKVFDPKEKGVLIQFETRIQQPVFEVAYCIKLLSNEGKNTDKVLFNPEEFSNQSSYEIMFGPDSKNGKKEILFKYQHENKISNEKKEISLLDPPVTYELPFSALYTLVVYPNNSYMIYVNLNKVKEGSLLNDQEFSFPLNPPKTIDDPQDIKPDNWDENEFIDDPEDTKPDDWDEEQPSHICDLSINKPPDWDDDEDGEWECILIQNPNFKGKWFPKKIKNPNFQGVWKARQIPNPQYYQDEHPSYFNPISAVGFEFFSSAAKIFFDNILVSYADDLEEAFEFAKKTWLIKFDKQKDVYEKYLKKYLEKRKKEMPIWDKILYWINENPYKAAVTGGLIVGTTILFLLYRCFGFYGLYKPKIKNQDKDKNEDKNEDKKEDKKEEKEEDKKEDKNEDKKEDKKEDKNEDKKEDKKEDKNEDKNEDKKEDKKEDKNEDKKEDKQEDKKEDKKEK